MVQKYNDRDKCKMLNRVVIACSLTPEGFLANSESDSLITESWKL